LREVDRRLPAELEDRRNVERMVVARLVTDDLQHALGVERLEVEAVGGVKIGRDRLGVGVDHDRGNAGIAKGTCGLDGRIVELDPLTDPDRPRTDHDGAVAAYRGASSSSSYVE
jgi:hypothetical protein